MSNRRGLAGAMRKQASVKSKTIHKKKELVRSPVRKMYADRIRQSEEALNKARIAYNNALSKEENFDAAANRLEEAKNNNIGAQAEFLAVSTGMTKEQALEVIRSRTALVGKR
jgi:hypothetical protein